MITIQTKQILFYIFMRNITEYHQTYDSENQFLTDIMHGLKQYVYSKWFIYAFALQRSAISINRWKLAIQSSKNSVQRNNFVVWKMPSVYMKIEAFYHDFVRKINMGGTGNFKKCIHPIKPDGYAI